MDRWLVAAVVALASTLGGGGSVSEAPALGAFEFIPSAGRLAARVGDRVQFAVSAEGARGCSWTVGDTAVSHDGAWTFVPAPEDVGERTVAVTVFGKESQPQTRTWQVTVLPMARPELLDVTPPPGTVALPANAPATFRCRAGVPGGRRSDRLQFTWILDGRPAHADEQGSDGVSEFPLATAEPGAYDVTLRVQVNDQSATTVTWRVEIAAPAPTAALPAEAAADAGEEFDPAPPVEDGEPAMPEVARLLARAPASVPVPTSEVPAREVWLEDIDVERSPDPAVHLRLSAPAGTDARTLPAGDGAPDRIYLDLRGARLARRVTQTIVGVGPLLRIRSGQFDATTTRVVLDLAGAVPFVLRHDEHGVVIQLRPTGRLVETSTPLTSAPARMAAPQPTPAPETPAEPASRAQVASVPVAPPESPGVAPTPAPEPGVSEAIASARPTGPTDATAAAPVRPPASAPGPSASTTSLPVVVIDAGHGGRDPGAAGVGGVQEKDVVLEVAHRLAATLTARLPVSVVMTRTDDSFVPIDGRLAMTAEDAVLFLSLHANACADPSPRGLEVFYGGGRVRMASTRSQDPRAALLGHCLYAALSEFGSVRHGPQPGSWGVLARNHVPSALVEIGYLTHPEEAARTQDAAYQERLVGALADGVGAFLRTAAPPL